MKEGRDRKEGRGREGEEVGEGRDCERVGRSLPLRLSGGRALLLGRTARCSQLILYYFLHQFMFEGNGNDDIVVLYVRSYYIHLLNT